jgi:hypothetical protein
MYAWRDDVESMEKKSYSKESCELWPITEKGKFEEQ